MEAAIGVGFLSSFLFGNAISIPQILFANDTLIFSNVDS